MEIYLYFIATVSAFVFFICLPLILVKPRKNKKLIHNLMNYHDLRKLFSSRYAKGYVMQELQVLFNVKALEILRLGRQHYFEFKFKSFRDSLHFKKAILLAEVCRETHITIISDENDFQVIFLAPKEAVPL